MNNIIMMLGVNDSDGSYFSPEIVIKNPDSVTIKIHGELPVVASLEPIFNYKGQTIGYSISSEQLIKLRNEQNG